VTTDSSRSFSVGDHVVHPHHGAGEVVAKRRRAMLGPIREYLTIRIAHIGMEVMVPSENASRVGLRRVISEGEAEKVVAALGRKAKHDPERWDARIKRYRAMVATGDAFELAAVLRKLAAREAAHHLTASEREMDERLRRALCSELAYALGLERAEAQACVDRALRAHARRACRQPDGETRLTKGASLRKAA
jgi:CarD family transcriptional regulator, regulator of rRNA transcription